MKIKFYGYDKCDTCRKALKFLKTNGADVDSIDITEQPPSMKELEGAARKVGVKKLFNTSGLVYREMKLGEKLPNLSDTDALKLLAKNGRLVKRPFAIVNENYLVGFKEADWKKEMN